MRAALLAVRTRVALMGALGALAFLAGCGGSSTGAISAPNATKLHRDVQRIRSAAAAGNAQLAHAAVTALRSDIGRLSARGQLAPSDAHLLTTEVAQVDGRISIDVKPAPSLPATPQPSAVTPSAPSVGSGNGDGHGKGHGHGGDGGDGGGDGGH